jgi:hypothetical protein
MRCAEKYDAGDGSLYFAVVDWIEVRHYERLDIDNWVFRARQIYIINGQRLGHQWFTYTLEHNPP